jgi:hypothetical protein
MRIEAKKLLGVMVVVVALVGLVAGCGDDSDSHDQLAEVTAERDALQAQVDAAAERHEKSEATQAAVVEIIADPAAFGSEDEVLDLLDQYAESPDITYGDEALGSTTYRTGWRNTLFGEVQADIQTWHRWLSADGSDGGSLWSWNGTALNGQPFTLTGIVLEEFNDEGLYSSLMVYYPMESDEVVRAFNEGN